jgi:PIN domain nuclease of toxin-antitoxin system
VILLDTHVLVWFAEDSPSLGRRATRLADQALMRNEVLISAVSFWEIAMLVRKRRLKLDLSAAALRRTVFDQGIREAPLDGAVGIVAAELDGFHGDPADRMVVATALAHGAALVTADEAILKWRGRIVRHDARH